MASLKGILFMFRSTGLMQALRVLSYTLKRQQLDRKYRQAERKQQRVERLTPGEMVGAEATLNGARLRFEQAVLQIDFLAPDLLRVAWEPGEPPAPYALAKTAWSGDLVALNEDPQGWRMTSQAMQVLIGEDGSLRFFDSAGSLLRDELPPERQGESWISQAHLRPEECLYGLGEQAGPLNLRRQRRYLWNSDPGGSYGPGADPLSMPIPIYLSLHQAGSYLIFYENSYPATFAFDQELDEAQVSEGANFAIAKFARGALRYYVIPGPPTRALERYTELTGRPDLPPLWSLGYHQSRWGYKNETDVRAVAAGFEEHDLPLSAIHLDIDYMDGYRIFTVDKQRFPDLGKLAGTLSEQGIRLVTIIDPGVKQDPNYYLYKEGREKGFFCRQPNDKPLAGVVWPGWSVYPDFTDPKVRAWWGEQYRFLLERGVAGIWHDMNEPTSFSAWGGQALPLAVRHKLDGQGGDHQQAHNLYALQMNRAGYEALRQQRPERRPWIVSRSGWASQQRYAWNWTGDTQSTWASLHMTIATALGQGLCGLPYTGPDIGGFSGNPSAELHLRWFQMAAFMPFFRTHSALGTLPREPWAYGEPYTSIARQFLRLRYRLLPYWYTLAWHASQTGHPLMRPLFWDDISDAGLWQVDDAFLLGDSLLVAPVLAERQTRRRVQLPAGRWYSLWDDTVFRGPGLIEIPTPLEQIPVLVRAGTVLPMSEGDQFYTPGPGLETYTPAPCLALHLYPPDGTASGARKELNLHRLYSDAGDGYGSQRLDRFQISGDEKILELTWQGEGDYPFPYPQVELCLHGMKAQRAWIEDRAVPIENNRIRCSVPETTGALQHIRIEV